MIAARIMAVLVGALCIAGTAAQEPTRGYLGVSVGQHTVGDWDRSVIDDGSLTSVSVEDSDVGFRILGGLDLSRNLAVEFGYADFGEVTADGTSDGSSFWAAGPVSAELSGNGFDLAFLGRLPVSDSFSAHARLGVLVWDADVSLGDSTGSISGSDDGNDALFGLGFELRTSELIAIRGDFIRYAFDDIDVDTLALSLVYRLP